ncbi:MAG: hypothetical protein U1F49_13705 [Rubrivivax sp.]
MYRWLAEKKPDVVVAFYNDHGLNFFLDKMPTFAVGAATETQRRRGLGILQLASPSPASRSRSAHHRAGHRP